MQFNDSLKKFVVMKVVSSASAKQHRLHQMRWFKIVRSPFVIFAWSFNSHEDYAQRYPILMCRPDYYCLELYGCGGWRVVTERDVSAHLRFTEASLSWGDDSLS